MKDESHLEQQLERLRGEVVRLRRTVLGGFILVAVVLFGGLYLDVGDRATFAVSIVIIVVSLFIIATVFAGAVSWWSSRRAIRQFKRRETRLSMRPSEPLPANAAAPRRSL